MHANMRPVASIQPGTSLWVIPLGFGAQPQPNSNSAQFSVVNKTLFYTQLTHPVPEPPIPLPLKISHLWLSELRKCPFAFSVLEGPTAPFAASILATQLGASGRQKAQNASKPIKLHKSRCFYSLFWQIEVRSFARPWSFWWRLQLANPNLGEWEGVGATFAQWKCIA